MKSNATISDTLSVFEIANNSMEASEKPLKSYESVLVSVVITTKNEAKNIGSCLESIKLQSWKNIEIIVVDNFSSDSTRDIVARYTKNFYLKGPERSAQRNFGMIQSSSGVYVMYVDADMLLSPMLVQHCVEFAQENQHPALHVSEIVLGRRYFSRVRRFEREFYDGTSIDGARFFHRQSFISVGGFDEKLFVKGSGEDWDIDKSMRRLGPIGKLPKQNVELSITGWPLHKFLSVRGVTYEPSYSGIYHNEAEFDLIEYLRKKYYYSSAFDGYKEKWGNDDPDIRRQFGFRYRYFTVFLENGKWRQLISRPDLALGMYMLRIFVGIVYIFRERKLL